MRGTVSRRTLAFGALSLALGGTARSAVGGAARVVEETVPALMREHDVPGMAVAVLAGTERRILVYGLASKAGGRRVDEATLFEIGSLSKPYTATLGAWAAERGALALSDRPSRHLPPLAGAPIDAASLLDLATYTAGGLPLQFPGGVSGRDGLVAYFRGWRPAFPPGTRRLYSNPSIGLFGHLAAASLGVPFDDAMERELLPRLGLRQTFVRVPRGRLADYAQGYARDGRPVRVGPGPLASEAYGVKATAADVLRFVEAAMGRGPDGDPALRAALAATRTGRYRAGGLVQGLGWEMYPHPTPLDRLLAGNALAFETRPVEPFEPGAASGTGLVNKTGSTNGFGAYAAFVPARGTAVVLLANRNYPIPARVRAGHRILAALEGEG